MNESNFQPSPGTSAGGAVDGLPTDDSGGFRPYVVGTRNSHYPLPIICGVTLPLSRGISGVCAPPTWRFCFIEPPGQGNTLA
jgi:hypothetical protein